MVKQHSPRFLAISEVARAAVNEVEASELRLMMEDGQPLVVLDVREKEEFDAGHLEGAIHLSKGVLERDVEKLGLADDARIVLYCGGGYRSAMAAKAMQEMGWTNVISLWGGWRGIQAEGLPLSLP
jgi:rhodanese-related sulfurtransferase